jgi:uncharacterized protein YebE (UPF0316 family)
MDTINEIIDQLVYLVAVGLDFVMENLITIEGVIAMVFITFVVGLISSIR